MQPDTNMPKTYQRCGKEVEEMASAILVEHDCYRDILDSKLKIDYVFAIPEYDEDGKPKGDSIKKDGYKVLGQCRVINLKDRAKGLGDVEILIDMPWWEAAKTKEAVALLDHELFHITVRKNKGGVFLRDDLNRPKVRMRKHDVQVGWFSVVAKRNGDNSQEQQQAAEIMERHGEAFWPEEKKS
jgi:hypothetical protein